MALDNITKAIATEAWSQLMHSIISDSPPDDMSREYYYAFPETGLEYLQEQLKHLQIHKYKLGTDSIQARMTSGMNSQVVAVDEHENENKNQQEIDHIQDRTILSKHSEVVLTDRDEYEQGIEHIRDYKRTTVDYEEVRANEDKYQQKIEDIQKFCSTTADYKGVQANEDSNADEDQYQQGIEHVQYAMISTSPFEMMQENEQIQHAMRTTNEFKVMQEYNLGIEHIQYAMRSTNPFEMMQENEQIQHAMRTTNEFKVMQEYNLGIEHIQYAMRSTNPFEMMQENEQIQYVMRNTDEYEAIQEYNLGIEHIQYAMRSTSPFEMMQENEQIEYASRTTSPRRDEMMQESEDKNHQDNEHSLGPNRQNEDEDENQQEDEYEKTKVLSNFYELLELVEKGDQPGEKQSTPRSEVLEAVELLHDTGGVDAARSILEKEFENMKQEYDDTENDPNVQFLKKILEILLRICETETCQSTICKIIGKAKGDRVSCKHCKVVQANEDENQHGMQAKEILTLFDELLKLVENGDVQGGEKPTLRFQVLKLIKVLHHYGVDTIRSAVEEELVDVNQKYDDIEKNPEIQYKKKGLEVMLRICDIETCQETLYQIIGTTERGGVYYT